MSDSYDRPPSPPGARDSPGNSSNPNLFNTRYSSASRAGDTYIPPMDPARTSASFRIDTNGGSMRLHDRPKTASRRQQQPPVEQPAGNVSPNQETMRSQEFPDSDDAQRRGVPGTSGPRLPPPTASYIKTSSGSSRLPPISKPEETARSLPPLSAVNVPPPANPLSPLSATVSSSDAGVTSAAVFPPFVPVSPLQPSAPSVPQFPQRRPPNVTRVSDVSALATPFPPPPPRVEENSPSPRRSRSQQHLKRAVDRRARLHYIALWVLMIIVMVALGIIAYSTWLFVMMRLGLAEDEYKGNLTVSGDLSASNIVSSTSVSSPSVVTNVATIQKPAFQTATLVLKEGPLTLNVGTGGTNERRFVVNDGSKPSLFELDFDFAVPRELESSGSNSSAPLNAANILSLRKGAVTALSSANATAVPSTGRGVAYFRGRSMLLGSNSSTILIDTFRRSISSSSLDIIAESTLNISASNLLRLSSTSVLYNSSHFHITASSSYSMTLGTASSFAVGTSTGKTLFYTSPNGRFGIGTSTPGATLHVMGDVIIEGSMIANASSQGDVILKSVVIDTLNTSRIRGGSSGSDFILSSYPDTNVFIQLPASSTTANPYFDVQGFFTAYPYARSALLRGSFFVENNLTVGNTLTVSPSVGAVTLNGSLFVAAQATFASGMEIFGALSIMNALSAPQIMTSSLQGSTNSSRLVISGPPGGNVEFLLPTNGSTSGQLVVGQSVLVVDSLSRSIGIAGAPINGLSLAVNGSAAVASNLTVGGALFSSSLSSPMALFTNVTVSGVFGPSARPLLVQAAPNMSIIFALPGSSPGLFQFAPDLLTLDGATRQISAGSSLAALKAFTIFGSLTVKNVSAFESHVNISHGYSLRVGGYGTSLSSSMLVVNDGLSFTAVNGSEIVTRTIRSAFGWNLAIRPSDNVNVTFHLQGSGALVVNDGFLIADPFRRQLLVGRPSETDNAVVVQGSVTVQDTVLVGNRAVTINESGISFPGTGSHMYPTDVLLRSSVTSNELFANASVLSMYAGNISSSLSPTWLQFSWRSSTGVASSSLSFQQLTLRNGSSKLVQDATTVYLELGTATSAVSAQVVKLLAPSVSAELDALSLSLRNLSRNSSIVISSDFLSVANGASVTDLTSTSVRSTQAFFNVIEPRDRPDLTLSSVNGSLKLVAKNGSIILGDQQLVVDSLMSSIALRAPVTATSSVLMQGSVVIANATIVRNNFSITFGDISVDRVQSRISNAAVMFLSPNGSTEVTAGDVATVRLSAAVSVISLMQTSTLMGLNDSLVMVANVTRFVSDDVLFADKSGSTAVRIYKNGSVDFGYPTVSSMVSQLKSLRVAVDKDVYIGGRLFVDGGFSMSNFSELQIGSDPSRSVLSRSGLVVNDGPSVAVMNASGGMWTSVASQNTMILTVSTLSIASGNATARLSADKLTLQTSANDQFLTLSLGSLTISRLNGSSIITDKLINGSSVFTDTILPRSGQTLSIGIASTLYLTDNVGKTAIGYPLGTATFLDSGTPVSLQVKGTSSFSGGQFADWFVARNNGSDARVVVSSTAVFVGTNDSIGSGASLQANSLFVYSGNWSTSVSSRALVIADRVSNLTVSSTVVSIVSPSSWIRIVDKGMQISDASQTANLSVDGLSVTSTIARAAFSQLGLKLDSAVDGGYVALTRESLSISNGSSSLVESASGIAIISNSSSNKVAAAGLRLITAVSNATYSLDISASDISFSVDGNVRASLSPSVWTVSSITGLNDNPLRISSAPNQDLVLMLNSSTSGNFRIVTLPNVSVLTLDGLSRNVSWNARSFSVSSVMYVHDSLYLPAPSSVFEVGNSTSNFARIDASQVQVSSSSGFVRVNSSVVVIGTVSRYDASSVENVTTLSSLSVSSSLVRTNEIRTFSSGNVSIYVGDVRNVGTVIPLAPSQFFTLGSSTFSVSVNDSGYVVADIVRSAGHVSVGNASNAGTNVASTAVNASVMRVYGSIFTSESLYMGDSLIVSASGAITISGPSLRTMINPGRLGLWFSNTSFGIDLSPGGLVISGNGSLAELSPGGAKLLRLWSFENRSMAVELQGRSDMEINLSQSSVWQQRFIIANNLLVVNAAVRSVSFGHLLETVNVTVNGDLSVSGSLSVGGSFLMASASSSLHVGNASFYSDMAATSFASVSPNNSAVITSSAIRLFSATDLMTSMLTAIDLIIAAVRSPVAANLSIVSPSGSLLLDAPSAGVRIANDMIVVQSLDIVMGRSSIQSRNMTSSILMDASLTVTNNATFMSSVTMRSSAPVFTVMNQNSSQRVTVTPDGLLVGSSSASVTVSADRIVMGSSAIYGNTIMSAVFASPNASDLVLSPSPGRDVYVTFPSRQLMLGSSIVVIDDLNSTVCIGNRSSVAMFEDNARLLQVFGESVFHQRMYLRRGLSLSSMEDILLTTADGSQYARFGLFGLAVGQLNSTMNVSATGMRFTDGSRWSMISSSQVMVDSLTSTGGNLDISTATAGNISVKLTSDATSPSLFSVSSASTALLSVDGLRRSVTLLGSLTSSLFASSPLSFSVNGSTGIDGSLKVSQSVHLLTAASYISVGAGNVSSMWNSSALLFIGAADRATFTDQQLSLYSSNGTSTVLTSGAIATDQISTHVVLSRSSRLVLSSTSDIVVLPGANGSFVVPDGLSWIPLNRTLRLADVLNPIVTVGRVTDMSDALLSVGGATRIIGELAVLSDVRLADSSCLSIGFLKNGSHNSTTIGLRKPTVSLNSSVLTFAQDGFMSALSASGLLTDKVLASGTDHDLVLQVASNGSVAVTFDAPTPFASFSVADNMILVKPFSRNVVIGVATVPSSLMVNANSSFSQTVTFLSDVQLAGSALTFRSNDAKRSMTASMNGISAVDLVSNATATVTAANGIVITDGFGNRSHLLASMLRVDMLSPTDDHDLVLRSSSTSARALSVVLSRDGSLLVNDGVFVVNGSTSTVSIGHSSILASGSLLHVAGDVGVEGSLKLMRDGASLWIAESSSNDTVRLNARSLTLSSTLLPGALSISRTNITIGNLTVDELSVRNVQRILSGPTDDLSFISADRRNILMDLKNGSSLIIGRNALSVRGDDSMVSIGGIPVDAWTPLPSRSLAVSGSASIAGHLRITGDFILPFSNQSLTFGVDALATSLSVAAFTLRNESSVGILSARSLTFLTNSSSTVLDSFMLATPLVRGIGNGPLTFAATSNEVRVAVGGSSGATAFAVVGTLNGSNFFTVDASGQARVGDLFNDSLITSVSPSFSVNGCSVFRSEVYVGGQLSLYGPSSLVRISSSLNFTTIVDASSIFITSPSSFSMSSSSGYTVTDNAGNSAVLNAKLLRVRQVESGIWNASSNDFALLAADGFAFASGMRSLNSSAVSFLNNLVVLSVNSSGSVASFFASGRNGLVTVGNVTASMSLASNTTSLVLEGDLIVGGGVRLTGDLDFSGKTSSLAFKSGITSSTLSATGLSIARNGMISVSVSDDSILVATLNGTSMVTSGFVETSLLRSPQGVPLVLGQGQDVMVNTGNATFSVGNNGMFTLQPSLRTLCIGVSGVCTNGSSRLSVALDSFFLGRLNIAGNVSVTNSSSISVGGVSISSSGIAIGSDLSLSSFSLTVGTDASFTAINNGTVRLQSIAASRGSSFSVGGVMTVNTDAMTATFVNESLAVIDASLGYVSFGPMSSFVSTGLVEIGNRSAPQQDRLIVEGNVVINGNLTVNGSVNFANWKIPSCDQCGGGGGGGGGGSIVSNSTFSGVELLLSNGTRSMLLTADSMVFKDGTVFQSQFGQQYLSVPQIVSVTNFSGVGSFVADFSGASSVNVVLGAATNYSLRSSSLDIVRSAAGSRLLEVPLYSVRIGATVLDPLATTVRSADARLFVAGNATVSEILSVYGRVHITDDMLIVGNSASVYAALDARNLTFRTPSSAYTSTYSASGIWLQQSGSASSSFTPSQLSVNSVRTSVVSSAASLSISSDISTIDLSVAGFLRLRVDSSAVISQSDVQVVSGRTLSVGTNVAGTLRVSQLDQDSVQVRGKDVFGNIIESRMYAGSFETMVIRTNNITSLAPNSMASIGLSASAVALATFDSAVRLSGSTVLVTGFSQFGDPAYVSSSTLLTVHGNARVRGALVVDGGLSLNAMSSLTIGNSTVDPQFVSVNGTASRSILTSDGVFVVSYGSSNVSVLRSWGLTAPSIATSILTPSENGNSLLVRLQPNQTFCIADTISVAQQTSGAVAVRIGTGASSFVTRTPLLTVTGDTAFVLPSAARLQVYANQTVVFGITPAVSDASRHRMEVGALNNAMLLVGNGTVLTNHLNLDRYSMAAAGDVLIRGVLRLGENETAALDADGLVVSMPDLGLTAIRSYGLLVMDTVAGNSSVSSTSVESAVGRFDVISTRSGNINMTLKAAAGKFIVATGDVVMDGSLRVAGRSLVVDQRNVILSPADTVFIGSSGLQNTSVVSGNVSLVVSGATMFTSDVTIVAGNLTLTDQQAIVLGLDPSRRLQLQAGGFMWRSNTTTAVLDDQGLTIASNDNVSVFTRMSASTLSVPGLDAVGFVRTPQLTAPAGSDLIVAAADSQSVVVSGNRFSVGGGPSSVDFIFKTDAIQNASVVRIGGKRRVTLIVGNETATAFGDPVSISSVAMAVDGNATFSGSVSVHDSISMKTASSRISVGNVVLNVTHVTVASGSSSSASRLGDNGLEVRDNTGSSSLTASGLSAATVTSNLVQCLSASCTLSLAGQSAVQVRANGVAVARFDVTDMLLTSNLKIDAARSLSIGDLLNGIMSLDKKSVVISGTDSSGSMASSVVSLDFVQSQLVKTARIVNPSVTSTAFISLSTGGITLEAPAHVGQSPSASKVTLNPSLITLNASSGVLIGDSSSVSVTELLSVYGSARIKGKLVVEGGLSVAGGLGSSFTFGNVTIDGSVVSISNGLSTLGASFAIFKSASVAGQNTTLTDSAVVSPSIRTTAILARTDNLTISPAVGSFVIVDDTLLIGSQSVTFGSTVKPLGAFAVYGTTALVGNSSFLLDQSSSFIVGSSSGVSLKVSSSAVSVEGSLTLINSSRDFALRSYGDILAYSDIHLASNGSRLVSTSSASSISLSSIGFSVRFVNDSEVRIGNGISIIGLSPLTSSNSAVLTSTGLNASTVAVDILSSRSSSLSLTVVDIPIMTLSPGGVVVNSGSLAVTGPALFGSDVMLNSSRSVIRLPFAQQSIVIGNASDSSAAYVGINSTALFAADGAYMSALSASGLMLTNAGGNQRLLLTASGVEVGVLTVSAKVQSLYNDLVLQASAGRDTLIVLSSNVSSFDVLSASGQTLLNVSSRAVLLPGPVVIGRSSMSTNLTRYGLTVETTVLLNGGLVAGSPLTVTSLEPIEANFTVSVAARGVTVLSSDSSSNLSAAVLSLRDGLGMSSSLSASQLSVASVSTTSIVGFPAVDLPVKASGVLVVAQDASKRIDLMVGTPGSAQLSVSASVVEVRSAMSVSGLAYLDSGVEVRSSLSSIYIYQSGSPTSARLQSSQLQLSDTSVGAGGGSLVASARQLSFVNSSTGMQSILTGSGLSAPRVLLTSDLQLAAGALSTFAVDASGSFSVLHRFNDSVTFKSSFSQENTFRIGHNRVFSLASGGFWVGANASSSSSIANNVDASHQLVVDGNVLVSGVVNAIGGVRLASANSSIQIGWSIIDTTSVSVSSSQLIRTQLTDTGLTVNNASLVSFLRSTMGSPSLFIGDSAGSVLQVRTFADGFVMRNSSSMATSSAVVQIGSRDRRSTLVISECNDCISSFGAVSGALSAKLDLSRHVLVVDGDSWFGGKSALFTSDVLLTPANATENDLQWLISTFDGLTTMRASSGCILMDVSATKDRAELKAASLSFSDSYVQSILSSRSLQFASDNGTVVSSLSSFNLSVPVVHTSSLRSSVDMQVSSMMGSVSISASNGSVSVQSSALIVTPRRVLVAAGDGVFIGSMMSNLSTILNMSLVVEGATMFGGNVSMTGSNAIFVGNTDGSIGARLSSDGLSLFDNGTDVASFSRTQGLSFQKATVSQFTVMSASVLSSFSISPSTFSATSGPGTTTLTVFASNGSMVIANVSNGSSASLSASAVAITNGTTTTTFSHASVTTPKLTAPVGSILSVSSTVDNNLDVMLLSSSLPSSNMVRFRSESGLAASNLMTISSSVVNTKVATVIDATLDVKSTSSFYAAVNVIDYPAKVSSGNGNFYSTVSPTGISVTASGIGSSSLDSTSLSTTRISVSRLLSSSDTSSIVISLPGNASVAPDVSVSSGSVLATIGSAAIQGDLRVTKSVLVQAVAGASYSVWNSTSLKFADNNSPSITAELSASYLKIADVFSADSLTGTVTLGAAGTTGDTLIMHTNLYGAAGALSQHMRVKINGVFYKIQLFADV